MAKTIYFKNFITNAIIVLMSFLILGGLFSFWTYRSTLTRRRDAMNSVAREAKRYIELYITQYSGELSDGNVNIELSFISGLSDVSVMVSTVDGKIVACSDDPFVCTHYDKYIPDGMIKELTAKGSYSGTTMLDGLFTGKRYVVSSPLAANGQTAGYLITSADTNMMTNEWRRFLEIFMLLALSVMCLTFIVSLLTTRRQAESLSNMVKAAKKLSRGDFTVRVEEPAPSRDDEYSQLERAFNAMADYLSRNDARRRELLANVSHELKTPMTVISGFADGLIDGTIPREEETKYLSAISSETKRLNRLVRRILDAARDDNQKIATETFDISEVIIQTLLGLSPKIESKNMDADPQLPEEPIFVSGERDSITQVVYNLIDNAVKFADDGSTLVLSLWKEGKRAFVSVEDRGATIPKDEMPLIFDRFYKVDHSRHNDRDGVGLGLYIVKSILDHHNQDIVVESEDGITRFTFSLELAQKTK